MEIVARKRLEILADAPLLPRIVAALRAAEIQGHTVVPAISGTGRGGNWQEEEVTGVSKKYVIAVASEKSAMAFVDAIGPLLDSHHMLLTVADVAVVRGERF